MAKLSYLDDIEIAAALLGLDTWAEDFDEQSIDQLVADKYNIDMEDFSRLVGKLIEFTPIQQSAITGEKYKGFVKDNCFIIKVEV